MGYKALEWQAGYGVVSFGTGDLEWVKDYIRNQRERHSSEKIVDRLERTTEMETAACTPQAP
jgi:REP element-mobilizing transposase RayT